MSPPSYMAYAIIGGVVLVSFIAWAIVGIDDAWFVPLAVIPFAVVYALVDRRLRHREGGGDRRERGG